MNGYDVGGRQLRVDRADQELPQTMAADSRPLAPPPAAAPTSSAAAATPTMASIGATLGAMSNEQLMEVLSQLKKMATNHPGQTRSLLAGNPALAYAVLQALLLMNLVDPSVMQRIVAAPPQLPTPAAVAAPAPNSLPAGAPMEPQQQALISQIMSLTPQQIDALPPQQREQVLQLVSACPQTQLPLILLIPSWALGDIETPLFPACSGISVTGSVLSSATLWRSPTAPLSPGRPMSTHTMIERGDTGQCVGRESRWWVVILVGGWTIVISPAYMSLYK